MINNRYTKRSQQWQRGWQTARRRIESAPAIFLRCTLLAVCFSLTGCCIFVSCNVPTPKPPIPPDPATLALQSYNSIQPLRTPDPFFPPDPCAGDKVGACALVLSSIYNANLDQAVASDFVSQEYRNLLTALTAAQAARLSGASFTVGSCVQGQNVLWASPGPAQTPRTICFSALLTRALFLQSAGTDLLNIAAQLDAWKIDKTQFNFTYQPRYSAVQGMTKDDLIAWFNANKPTAQAVWTHFKGSIDFVIAHEMAHILLDLPPGDPGAEQKCDLTAASILKSAQAGVDPSAFGAVLQAAMGRNSTDPWGFETVGDASPTSASLPSAQPQ